MERLLQIILDYSVFEFNGKKDQQRFRTTMGTKSAPSYANRFMVKEIDDKICEIGSKYMDNRRKKTLDEIFLLFVVSIKKNLLVFVFL